MDVGACVWALGMPRFTDAGVSSAPLERQSQRYFTVQGPVRYRAFEIGVLKFAGDFSLGFQSIK